MTLSAGAKLGRYKVRSKIGEGGVGEVYLAEDTGLERRVAIKFLPPALTDDTRSQVINERNKGSLQTRSSEHLLHL